MEEVALRIPLMEEISNWDMYPHKLQVRSQSAKTPEEIRSICKQLHSPVPHIYDEEFEIDSTHAIETSKWILGSKHEQQQHCILDAGKADSFSPLEESHFQRAMGHGIFNGVTAKNKRDRKKRYRNKKKAATENTKMMFIDNDKSSWYDDNRTMSLGNDNRTMSLGNDNEGYMKYKNNNGTHDDKLNTKLKHRSQSHPSPMYASIPKQHPISHSDRRRRSGSCDLGSTGAAGSSSSDYKRKHRHKSRTTHGEQLCRELSSSGIDILSMSDSMQIEEIHALQERFFSSLNMKDGLALGRSMRSNSVF